MSLGSIVGWLVIGFVLVMVYRVMRDVFAYQDHEDGELELDGATEEVKETPESVTSVDIARAARILSPAINVYVSLGDTIEDACKRILLNYSHNKVYKEALLYLWKKKELDVDPGPVIKAFDKLTTEFLNPKKEIKPKTKAKKKVVKKAAK